MNERSTFRYVVGLIALIGGMAGLYGLFNIEVPEGNREPMLLALGIVLGWGSAIVNGEWGSSPAGRQAAQAGIDASVEMAKTTAKTAEVAATRLHEQPTDVRVVNPPEDPANVTETQPEPEATDLPDYAK